MAPLRIAIAQTAPRLGALEENLARHAALIGAAREQGARDRKSTRLNSSH